MTEAPAVAVDNVVFRYGERTALAGVSFEVGRGEVFGLLGPNGGGKTTLFRILSTLLEPAEGRATIFGSDVKTESLEVRRHIGVVFQNQSLDRRLSVEENLVCQGHLYGIKGTDLKARIEDAMRQTGVLDRRADGVESLSGGLRRRVELAKCLLHRPRLLLLDEPSTGRGMPFVVMFVIYPLSSCLPSFGRGRTRARKRGRQAPVVVAQWSGRMSNSRMLIGPSFCASDRPQSLRPGTGYKPDRIRKSTETCS